MRIEITGKCRNFPVGPFDERIDKGIGTLRPDIVSVKRNRRTGRRFALSDQQLLGINAHIDSQH